MTLSGRDLRVAVAVFFLIALPSCKQILGLHDRSEATDAGASVIKPVSGLCGSLVHPSSTCAACMDEKCCTEANACHDDPACDPAFDCASMCGDDGVCRARCTTFLTRSDTLSEVTACREKNCQKQCGNECGGFGYAAPGCDGCIKVNCCTNAIACAQNADCLKLDVCKTNCIAGSSTCPPECEATYPNGFDNHQDWNSCVQNTCGDACQGGRNWQCLDARQPWIKPKSGGEITFSITMVDVLNEPPFAGTTVHACRKLDLDCTSPIDTQVTDKDGFVSLTVPAGSVGFDGYIDFKGGDNGSGSPIFPAIWYPSPNIVSAGWRGRIQAVSVDSLAGLAVLTKATIDPTRGHFAANAQDCNFVSAGNVTFAADSSDEKTTPFYFVGGTPKTNANQTDPLSGIGGFINLPGGGLTLVTASVPVGGQMKTIGSLTYIIRPGTFTTTSISPIP